MTADQVRRLRPTLDEFLGRFDDCFPRRDTRAHLPTYVAGQLSDLHRKSVEPIAVAADVPPKTLQQFLSLLRWDHGRLRDRLQRIVAAEHASPHAIGIIDDTACRKQGDKTPGVKRQWCNATGKTDNCIVTVHLAYAAGDSHCLLDSESYLPEDWADDRDRCRAAGIPDGVAYRPKWQIALELLDVAAGNGVRFAWLTFDEGYGGKPGFLRGLAGRGHRYVAEVPSTFAGWLAAPRVTGRPYRKGGKGRGRKAPRLVAGSPPARSVAEHLASGAELRDRPRAPYRVKAGTKGPMVWEVKRVTLIPKGEGGLPEAPVELLIARYGLKPEKVEFFVANVSPEERTEALLIVAFARWGIERCFAESKDELEFDHFEGRSYVGLRRHQALTAVSYLFLSRARGRLRGGKPGGDDRPGADGGRGVGSVVVARRAGREAIDRSGGPADPAGAGAEPGGPRQPRQADAAPAA